MRSVGNMVQPCLDTMKSVDSLVELGAALALQSSGRISFDANMEIFRESELGEVAYLIEEGYVRLSRRVGNEQETVALLGPGEVFGEIAVLDGHPRTATATALHDCALIPFSRAQIEAAMSREDPLVELLLRSSLQRLRTLQGGSSQKLPHVETLPGVGRLSATRGLDSVKQRVSESVKCRIALEEAIQSSKLTLVYQPIVSLADGTIAGYEALARWPDAPPGHSSPDRFIPIAERSGLIVPLGEWILSTGLRALKRLCREAESRMKRERPLFMSVNVSPWQITRPADVHALVSIIERESLPPGSLKMEITESAMLRGGDAALEALGRFKEAGLDLAIDDFGTGYSSLSYLHRFPIDVLKIDRAFTNSLSDGENGRRIVSAILSLAQELRIDVVAEGIEAREEADWLRERRCRFGQGYLFSRPVTLDGAAALLGSQFL